jgi:hypothetical protein
LAPLRDKTFFSVEEANQAVQALAKEVLDRTMKHLGRSRREVFEEIECPALRPLPEKPYAYTEIRLATVHLDYHVECDHHYYPGPARPGRAAFRTGCGERRWKRTSEST